MIKFKLNIDDKIELKSGEIGFIAKVIKQGDSFEVEIKDDIREIKYSDIVAQYIKIERQIVHDGIE